jgi:hypothetical protein
MASTPGSLKTDPYTFINSGLLTFTRSSIAARVKSLGLIEEVPINTARLDHDPVTLTPKGMLIEEKRTNLSIQLSSWTRQGITLKPSIDFPLYVDGKQVFILRGSGGSGFKRMYAPGTIFFVAIVSVYLRKQTNRLA